MKKKRLEIDYEVDFRLIGLCTPIKPHKLAWELNQRLNIGLCRMSDYELPTSGESILRYIYFLHTTGVSTIRMFRNRPLDSGAPEAAKWLLVPEHPQFDYIIMTSSRESDQAPAVLEAAKNIPTTALSAFLPLASLKSTGNFIF